MRTISVLAVAIFAALLPGCRSDVIHFTDSIDIEFDFAPLPPSPFDRPDYLHLPYAQGAEFWVTAHRDHAHMNLWEAEPESLDPSVLRIIGHPQNTDEWVKFRVRAVGPGVTDLVVYRNNARISEWGRTPVEVGKPTGARLFFSGPVLLGWPFEDTEVGEEANVLTKGAATFLVRMYDGAVRLFGNGVMDAMLTEGDANVVKRETYLFEDRDWVQVTPQAEGTHRIAIQAGGETVRELLVQGVTDEDIDFIALDGQSEKYARSGDTLGVLAVGYTSDGEPIYGIEFDWYADGKKKSGEGDIYMYEYWRDFETELEAGYGDHTDYVFIHSEHGWVTSSNRLGCTTGTDGSTGPVSLVLLGCALALVLSLRSSRTTRG